MGHHKEFDVEMSSVKVTLEDVSTMEKRDRGLEAVEEGAEKAVGGEVDAGDDAEEEEEPIQWNKVRDWSPFTRVSPWSLEQLSFLRHLSVGLSGWRGRVSICDCDAFSTPADLTGVNPGIPLEFFTTTFLSSRTQTLHDWAPPSCGCVLWHLA